MHLLLPAPHAFPPTYKPSPMHFLRPASHPPVAWHASSIAIGHLQPLSQCCASSWQVGALLFHSERALASSTNRPGLAPPSSQEANFYHCAAYASPIPEYLWMGGKNESGVAPIGCPNTTTSRLSREALQYAVEIADDEVAHVILLKTVLGDAAVPMPLIDIGSAFQTAAAAAAGLPNASDFSPRFNPYVNDLYFYHAAFIFEDVGVTAYAVSQLSLSAGRHACAPAACCC
jgi:Ferritin-like domain